MRGAEGRAKADSKARKAGLADTPSTASCTRRTTTWLAYDGLDTEARVVGLLRELDPVPVLTEGEVGTVVLDRTTFYAESGGQHTGVGVLAAGLRVEGGAVQHDGADLALGEDRDRVEAHSPTTRASVSSPSYASQVVAPFASYSSR